MLVGRDPLRAGRRRHARHDRAGRESAIGLSTIVFAGASQLAAADVLAEGGGALVAVIAACTINLRMLLYSASLAPHLAHVPLRRRLLMAYVLTDQAYAVSITRWTGEAVRAGEGGPAPELDRRVPYYLGAGLTAVGQLAGCTILGVLIGSAVPDSLPLDFAVPLVFLVLLVPTITSRPAAVGCRSSAAASRCSPPSRGRDTCRCCSAHWPASRPAPSPRSRSSGERRETTPRCGPSQGQRHEPGLDGDRAGRHRHLRDARLVPRVRAPARRRAAGRCSACCARSRRPPWPRSCSRRCCAPRATSTCSTPGWRPARWPTVVAWRTRNIALTLVVGMAAS